MHYLHDANDGFGDDTIICLRDPPHSIDLAKDDGQGRRGEREKREKEREKRGRRRGEGENIGAVSARLESRYVRSPKAGRRPMPAAGVVIYFVEVSSSSPIASLMLASCWI